MRLLVCGSRNFDDNITLGYWLINLNEANNGIEVIHGDASGADKMAGRWALEHERPCRPFPAQWSKYGKGAGPARNHQMLNEGKPEMLIAFKYDFCWDSPWRPGIGGTEHMVSIASKAGVPCLVVNTQLAGIESI